MIDTIFRAIFFSAIYLLIWLVGAPVWAALSVGLIVAYLAFPVEQPK